MSKMVYTKVVSNKSPWLQGAELGKVYCNPASHGEGRFVANEEWLAKLRANGQIAIQYSDPNGNLSVSEEWNPNFLNWLIQTRKTQSKYEVAISKWQEDLQFVKKFELEEREKVNIKGIFVKR